MSRLRGPWLRTGGLGVWVAVACGRPAPPPVGPVDLDHAVYVWQRIWTPPVRAAVDAAAADFDERIVLAVETDATGEVWTGVWSADGAPQRDPPRTWRASAGGLEGRVGLALRWADGAAALEEGAVAEQVRTVLQRAGERGWHVSSVHLDADVPTARLAEWAAIVRPIADENDVPVTVLSLVDHVGRPGWPALRAAADAVVLQVHSVPLDRAAGPTLLDVAVAEAALDRALAGTGAGLSVALPTHTLVDARTGAAVRAEPAEVAAWLARLDMQPPTGLDGIAWFRLPVEGDDTTWTRPALAAVRAGREPTQTLEVRLAAPPGDATPPPGVQAVWVEATGEDHVALPALEVCPAEGRVAVVALDDRYGIAGPLERCWRARPRSHRLVAPGRTTAVALLVADGPVSVSVVEPAEPGPDGGAR